MLLGFYEKQPHLKLLSLLVGVPAMLMKKYLLGIQRDSEGFGEVS